MEPQYIEVVGKIISDGNAIALDLGFIPDYFEVVNANATTTEAMTLQYWSGMAAGTALARTANGVGSISTDGITPLNTVTISTTNPVGETVVQGVTIDADFSDDNDVLYYRAKRCGVANVTLS